MPQSTLTLYAYRGVTKGGGGTNSAPLFGLALTPPILKIFCIFYAKTYIKRVTNNFFLGGGERIHFINDPQIIFALRAIEYGKNSVRDNPLTLFFRF